MAISTPPPETALQAQRFARLWQVSLGLTALLLIGLVAYQGAIVLGRLAALAVSAQLIGKWVIFVGADPDNPYGFDAWSMAALITVLDLWIGVGLNAFLPQLERLPRLGSWLSTTRRKARETFLQYPRLKRMAFWGVVLWVVLPLPASGAITGSFVTRLVGLSRFAGSAAIVLASAINGLVFAAMASLLGAHSEALLNNRAVTIAGSVCFAALLWFGWRRLRRLLREG